MAQIFIGRKSQVIDNRGMGSEKEFVQASPKGWLAYSSQATVAARVMSSVELLGFLLEPTISTSPGRQVAQAGWVAWPHWGPIWRQGRHRVRAAQPSSPGRERRV